jgi:hypothetical protein
LPWVYSPFSNSYFVFLFRSQSCLEVKILLS